MSIHTGTLPSRSAFAHDAIEVALTLTAASRSRPSCVGLTEICASRPAALHLVEHVEVVLR